jgi:hypothetical protein
LRKALVLASALAALAAPEAALAHVTVSPPFVEAGARTTLAFAAPNERAPRLVTRLTVRFPNGIRLSAVSPPSGWTVEVAAREVVWSDGRVGPQEVQTFRVAATADLAPGTVTIDAVETYDDGGHVRYRITLTVLPERAAPREHLWPALLAGVAGVVAIGGALTWLRLRRRA